MRIIQITDLHLAASGEDAGGVDTWRNIDLVLEEITKLKSDLIVFTGDFCYDLPREETYVKLAERLKYISTPMRFIGGNHDTEEMVFMLRQMLGQDKYQKAEQYPNGDFLYLNSIEARLPEHEYELLEEMCRVKPEKPLIIFTHYPPVKIGMPFMDRKHPFAEAERMQGILSQSSRPVKIFCGHYHNESSYLTEKYEIYCTPSTCYQMDDQGDEFVFMSYDAGYRVINLNPGSIRTTVRYISRPWP